MEQKLNLVFENLWQKNNTVYHAGVRELWKKHFPAIDPKQWDERLPQVVFVVRTEAGEVVGVSTAYRSYIEQLKHYLYAFRCFVAEDFRQPGLASALTVKTRDWMEEIHLTDGPEDKRCIGMITLVENENLKKYRNEAVWRSSQMVYIGNSAQGHHIRVYYFKNAVI